MTFGAPEWFWGFLLLPLLAAVFLRNEARRVSSCASWWPRAFLPEPWPPAASPARRRTKFAFALLGLAGILAALTQPRYGEEMEESQRRGLDVMIAIDTSKSMLSTDVQPDRLSRAKFAAQDLLDALAGDRVGLIAFAGTAFVQAPLTIDDSAVLASHYRSRYEHHPARRHRYHRRHPRRRRGFRQRRKHPARAHPLHRWRGPGGDMPCRPRGEQKGNFRIFTVGVGTKEGSLIPVPDQAGGTALSKMSRGSS